MRRDSGGSEEKKEGWGVEEEEEEFDSTFLFSSSVSTCAGVGAWCSAVEMCSDVLTRPQRRMAPDGTIAPRRVTFHSVAASFSSPNLHLGVVIVVRVRFPR